MAQSLLWKALCFFPREKPRVDQTCSQAELLPRFSEMLSSLGELQRPRQIPLCLSVRIKTKNQRLAVGDGN